MSPDEAISVSARFDALRDTIADTGVPDRVSVSHARLTDLSAAIAASVEADQPRGLRPLAPEEIDAEPRITGRERLLLDRVSAMEAETKRLHAMEAEHPDQECDKDHPLIRFWSYDGRPCPLCEAKAAQSGAAAPPTPEGATMGEARGPDEYGYALTCAEKERDRYRDKLVSSAAIIAKDCWSYYEDEAYELALDLYEFLGLPLPLNCIRKAPAPGGSSGEVGK